MILICNLRIEHKNGLKAQIIDLAWPQVIIQCRTTGQCVVTLGTPLQAGQTLTIKMQNTFKNCP